MDLSYVKAFINATKEVMKSFSDEEIVLKDKLKSVRETKFDKSIVQLDISGDLKGKVVFSMPDNFLYDFIKKVARHTLDIEIDFQKDTDTLKAMLHELGNEISGQAVTLLNINGLNCNLSVPEVDLDNKKSNLDEEHLYEMGFVFTSTFGDFILFLYTKEVASRYPAMLMVNLPSSLAENIAVTYILNGIEVYNAYTFSDTKELIENKVFDFLVIDIDRLTINFTIVWDELLQKSQNKQLKLIIVSARTQEQALEHIKPIKPIGYLYKYQSELEVCNEIQSIISRIGFSQDKIKRNIKLHLPHDNVVAEISHPHTKEILHCTLNDISPVGMACYVHDIIDETIKEKELLGDIKLYLRKIDFYPLRGQILSIQRETQQMVVWFKNISDQVKQDIALYMFRHNSPKEEERSIFKDIYKTKIASGKELKIAAEKKVMDLKSSMLFITKDLHLAKLLAKQLSAYGIKIMHERNIFKGLVIVKRHLPKVVMISNEIPKNEVYSFLARLRQDMGIENLPTLLTIDKKLSEDVKYTEEEINNLIDSGLTEVVDTTDKSTGFVSQIVTDISTPDSKYGNLFFDNELADIYSKYKKSHDETDDTEKFEIFLKGSKTVVKIDNILSKEYVGKLFEELEYVSSDDDMDLEFVVNLKVIPKEYMKKKTVHMLFPFLERIKKENISATINIIHSTQSEKLHDILSKVKDFPKYRIFSNLSECMDSI